MTNIVKVTISGASGQIGYALLFRIASGQMFGHDTHVELNLLELPSSMGSLQGVVMELEDCAFPLLKSVNTTTELNVAMRDADWALLIGAAPRKAGMERSELLRINGNIFAEQGRALNDNAARHVKVLVVGNPCNTNCFIAMHHAKDLAPENFFALTMLDENRARAQLALHAACPVAAVSNMHIWGNHSSTQFPDFYHATINGQSALNIIKDETWLRDTFIPKVQQRGAAVINTKGSSSAASAANAVVQTVHHIVTPTANQAFSVARCSQGEYGIDAGLIYSFPCTLSEHKVVPVVGLVHNEFAEQQLKISLDELRQERDAVLSLGLLN